MKWITAIENFFLKAEKFFSNFDFIARLANSFDVAMKAFNDKLHGRNSEALKKYLSERASTEPAKD